MATNLPDQYTEMVSRVRTLADRGDNWTKTVQQAMGQLPATPRRSRHRTTSIPSSTRSSTWPRRCSRHSVTSRRTLIST